MLFFLPDIKVFHVRIRWIASCTFGEKGTGVACRPHFFSALICMCVISWDRIPYACCAEFRCPSSNVARTLWIFWGILWSVKLLETVVAYFWVFGAFDRLSVLDVGFVMSLVHCPQSPSVVKSTTMGR